MYSYRPLLAVLALLVAACAGSPPLNAAPDSEPAAKMAPAEGNPAAATQGERGVAVFAGGCFWCVESAYDDLDGVYSAVSGYTGGKKANPGYYEVAGGKTRHAEAVRVVYDPAKLSYAKLIDVFWKNVDPFQRDGQFCDHGPQYRSEVYVADPVQRALAEKTRADVAKRFGREVVTKVSDASIFWPAEEYHQDFHRKSPVRYLSYRMGCGRDRRLAELWGKSEH
jgi:peptide-methionine (S)-S-oxide reductase